MSNVVHLGPHARMTVDEALEVVKREQWTDIMLIGYKPDGDFSVRSSHMSRENAAFLLELAKYHVFQPVIKNVAHDDYEA